jgi:hypothetical protein
MLSHSNLLVCVPCRYSVQEAQRVELQRGQWKCGICSQTVRGSHHLDAHMDELHQDQLVEASRGEDAETHRVVELASHIEGHGVVGTSFSAKTLRMQTQC